MKSKTKIIALAMASSFSLSLLGCAPTPETPAQTQEVLTASEESTTQESQPSVSEPITTPQASNTAASDETALAYLRTYFDIDSLEEVLTTESWNANLQKILGDKTVLANQEQTKEVDFIVSAVQNAGFDELALSYPIEKTKERLSFYGVTMPEDAKGAAYLACALDSGLISANAAEKIAANQTLSAEEWADVLYNIADANALSRNFIGYSNDPDIYSKLQKQWESFELVNDEALMKIGTTSVENKITTGFNFKQAQYDSKFLPELTLQYGHSDIKHAHQLLALLNSEDIVARVQLEPKVSAYEYLLEWGEPPAATDTYEVKKISDDFYITYAVEYDLLLEFDTPEEKEKFDEVIKKYAKKYEGNAEADGLIYASWWQPLYSSTAEMTGDYNLIYDCVVDNGSGYSLHLFTLPEKKDQVVSELQNMNNAMKVTAVERYCNKAFFEYLSGEDYQ